LPNNTNQHNSSTIFGDSSKVAAKKLIDNKTSQLYFLLLQSR